ncbi:MAG: O-antigen ligase family protein [Clostridia bacterium]|nr:O-antigen ligase family protein [Clostridia bacterium]
MWTHNTVMPLVRVVIERLPYIGFLAELLIPMSIILSAMACLPWFLRHIRGRDLAVYICAVLIVLFSMVLHPITVDYLQEEWWRILIAAVPMYFIGVSFSLEDSKNDLFWCSLFSVLGMFAFRLYLLNSGRALENDDMEAAYRMLPSIMYLIYYASVKKQVIYIAIAGVLSTVILIFGTRGPIVCMLVYVALLTIYYSFKSRNLKKLLILLIIFAIVLSVFIFDTLFIEVSSALSKVFERIGFSTRIFNFIIEGDIIASKGRESLAKQAIEAIIENPMWGYGVTADRAMFGIYPHNMFLEILCQYGIVFGSLLIITMLVITVIALLKSRKNTRRFTFGLMLVSIVFVKLMISSTYTIEPLLYFMLGYFVLILRKKR